MFALEPKEKQPKGINIPCPCENQWRIGATATEKEHVHIVQYS